MRGRPPQPSIQNISGLPQGLVRDRCPVPRRRVRSSPFEFHHRARRPVVANVEGGGRDQASCECLLRTDAKFLVSSGAALQSAVAPFSTGAAARAAGDASTPRFRRNTIRNHLRCYASGPRRKASGPQPACSPLSRCRNLGRKILRIHQITDRNPEPRETSGSFPVFHRGVADT